MQTDCIDSTALARRTLTESMVKLTPYRRIQKNAHSFFLRVWKGTQANKIKYGALALRRNKKKTVHIHYYMILCLVFQRRIVSRESTHATCIAWIINEQWLFRYIRHTTKKTSIFKRFQRKHDFPGFNQLHTPTDDCIVSRHEKKIEDSICFSPSRVCEASLCGDWRREWLLFCMKDGCVCFVLKFVLSPPSE